MNISYHDLKEAVYIMLFLLGISLFLAGSHFMSVAGAAEDPVSFLISGMILLLVAAVSMFFAVETYLLRDDPDVWR